MKDLAYWQSKEPLPREKAFLNKRKYLDKLNHIDQLWDYLKIECGDTLAVSDLRGENHEKFSYKEFLI